MAYILSPSASGTYSLNAQEYVGEVLVTKGNVTYQGQGVDATVIKHDAGNASLPTVVFPTPPLTPPGDGSGPPIAECTFRDMTIDANGAQYGSGGAEASGPGVLRFERCRFLGHTSHALLSTGARRIEAVDCEFIGDQRGIAIQIAGGGCAAAVVKRCHAYGGRAFFVVSNGAYGHGIVLEENEVELDYWLTPASTRVATGTVYTATGVTADHGRTLNLYDVFRALVSVGTATAVATRVMTMANAQRWDRLEHADGRWTQVLEVSGTIVVLDRWRKNWLPQDPPTGDTVAHRRPVLGRCASTGGGPTVTMELRNGQATRWRYVSGAAAPTPANDTPLEILDRVNHADTGALNLTPQTRGALVRGNRFRGGFSDHFTIGGTDHVVQNNLAECGQDMGFTTLGDQVLIGCVARDQGVHGFISQDGGARFVACVAQRSGRNLNWGYGFYADTTGVRLISCDAFGDATGAIGRSAGGTFSVTGSLIEAAA